MHPKPQCKSGDAWTLSDAYQTETVLLDGLDNTLDDGSDRLKTWIGSFATACDAGATAWTTKSGSAVRAYAIAEEGRWPAGMTLQREVGSRFAYISTNAARILHHTGRYKDLVAKGHLTIENDALEHLLEDRETRLVLAVLTLVNAFFLKALQYLKKDGVKNSKYAEEVGYPAITELISVLKKGVLPEWVSEELVGVTQAKTIATTKGNVVKFKKLLKETAGVMEETWTRYLSSWPQPSNATEAQRNATACTNDYVEGFNGYLAWVSGRLMNQTNPCTVLGLAMWGYNSKSLAHIPLKMKDIVAAQKEPVESIREVYKRIHAVDTKVAEENRLAKKFKSHELREQYEKLGLPATQPLLKKDVAKAIATETYTPPSDKQTLRVHRPRGKGKRGRGT